MTVDHFRDRAHNEDHAADDESNPEAFNRIFCLQEISEDDQNEKIDRVNQNTRDISFPVEMEERS
jgi:hypothetical protein